MGGHVQRVVKFIFKITKHSTHKTPKELTGSNVCILSYCHSATTERLYDRMSLLLRKQAKAQTFTSKPIMMLKTVSLIHTNPHLKNLWWMFQCHGLKIFVNCTLIFLLLCPEDNENLEMVLFPRKTAKSTAWPK